MKKVIVCIGDSLTEGDYGVKGKRGIANVQPKGYPYFLEQIMDCEARNFGKCGYTAENVDKATPDDMQAYYSLEEQSKYGVVGIEISLL